MTIWLDGGLATELERAGIVMAPPWWGTRALNSEANRVLLRRLHESYIQAGAQMITANTFRCNLRALRRLGLDDAGNAWMVHAAVGVAAAAAGTGGTQIAASIGPAEDAYRPDLVPSDAELHAEHRWLATELARSGVTLILVETMNCTREARIALEEVQASGGRAFVSFACGPGARLLSGEPLGPAGAAVAADGAQAVLVNCTGPADTEWALAELRDACPATAIGAYPNIEDRHATAGGALPAVLTPAAFADLTARWQEKFELAILGGCCGSTPAHIAAACAGTSPAGRAGGAALTGRARP